jgi:ABC-type glycerol-3-phosphate transport system substrate-binding protein
MNRQAAFPFWRFMQQEEHIQVREPLKAVQPTRKSAVNDDLRQRNSVPQFFMARISCNTPYWDESELHFPHS